MKQTLRTIMFPDFRHLNRADAIAFLTYVTILIALLSTPLPLAIIAAIAILLPAGYLTIALLTARQGNPTTT